MNTNELKMNTGILSNGELDTYPLFEKAVKERFNKFVSEGRRLFKTNAEGLFDVYLQFLPQADRESCNCNSCRSFFNRYGDLVSINSEGEKESVLWSIENMPPKYIKPVEMMKYIVESSVVKTVFLSEERVLGTPVTGQWTHLSVSIPSTMVYRSRLSTAGQAMAEKAQEFQMVIRALQEYTADTVDQALALIKSETMYRSDRVLGNAKWFKDLMTMYRSARSSEEQRNIVWLAVASAPAGFAHVRSSMIGTLLEDIASGMPMNRVASRFAEKMNPANYMRSESAPTENGIQEAERVVAQLGIEDSLLRRYAKIEEVPEFLWKDRSANNVTPEKKSTGVFGHLQAKPKTESNLMSLPVKVMAWDRFERTVLPTADKLEVLMDNPSRLMALVTAAVPDSENIMKWDNPFSWYYHGGADGEIKRRVEAAGGRHEDNEIRVSLIWEGLTDLDLHCITPLREKLMYNNKRGRCGGYLDLDMNGLDKHSETPVENMRWTSAPEGRYRFIVHNYSEKVNRRGTPYRVELEVNGKVYHYDGEALQDSEKQTVFEFDYVKGQDPAVSGNASSKATDWSVQQGEWVKVNGITDSPNLWGRSTSNHAGTHTFFLLDGVRDLSDGMGRGFFNEMLTPELRQIRKTLELFTANTPIEGAEEATACGVGFSKDTEWNVTIKVTEENTSRLVKIDRW